MSESQWIKQGGTFSHKNACKEFGLKEEEIIDAMKAGKLQYRQNYAHGNPYFRVLRTEIEALAVELNGNKAVEDQKIKKGAEEAILQLVKNPDIVSAVAANEHSPFTVGFAAETQDVLGYARDKMQRKGLDMIIANDVSDQGIGFNSDENEVTVLWETGEQILERAGKSAIARQIMALIANATGN